MNRILKIYDRLYSHFGPQHWWPGDTPFEIMVGAVLTQNTNWNNVSRAIANLKEANLLSFQGMLGLEPEIMAGYVRPAGYYNLKTQRLRNLLLFIAENHEGDVEAFLDQETGALRQELLAIKGIGPETADSIVLYAAQKPTFVVDAYTHRILTRHALAAEEDGYYEIQEIMTDHLAEDVQLFNEYHALLVRLGKEFCKKSKPLCRQCPLEGF